MSDKRKTSVILIKNKDDKYNRDTFDKIKLFAKKNPCINFFYVNNTDKNIDFLKKKFPQYLEDVTNYPKMIVVKDDQSKLYQMNNLLSFTKP